MLHHLNDKNKESEENVEDLDKEIDKPTGETKFLNEPHCSGCKNETTLFRCEECGKSFGNKCLTESHDIINMYKKNGIDYRCDMMHKNPCIRI